MKYFFYCLTFIFYSSPNLFANSGVLIGTITDNSTGAGIPGVNVFIEGTTNGDFSDGKGNFTIGGLSEGKYALKISSIGYHSETHLIQIESGRQAELYVSLKESIEVLEGVIVNRVSMVGGSSRIGDIAGSAHYMSPKELNKFSNTDINRALRNIPGIIIQEEEGFGLRPNIGMRGTGLERSSKITIMEDGILIAPAPYSAPAAYYFPSSGRMSGIEVRKGSSQIKYGPYTTGGAINFISSPITNEKIQVGARFIGGNMGYKDIYGNVGMSNERFGFMVESMFLGSDGFKELDNGGNTGFLKEDYMAKVRLGSKKDAKVYQSFNIKAGLTKENSNETYVGLTDSDFSSSPFRRYAGSQVDKMINEQNQYHLRHVIRPAKFIDITTTLYHNEFSRNWYKLDKVKASDSTDKISISKIFNDPAKYNNEMAIIKGTSSENEDALFVKANNRSYYSQGIESIIGLNFATSTIRHDVEIGIRLHHDQMDRFQWVDEYKMSEGTMMMTKAGIPGTESNYLLDANAFASYLQYNLSYFKLSLMPGIRYENIKYEKTNYGKTDPDRTGSELSVTDNGMDIFIPGIGIDYKFSDNASAFLGIHKGFTPSGAGEEVLPETSINYEVGYRYINHTFSFQPVIYYNNYDNLLGSDLASSGGGGTINQYNGGRSLIYGLELETTYDFLAFSGSKLRLPLSFNYTYTNATFQNSFESEFEPWGQVVEGDEIPYIPEHQFALNLSLQGKKYEINVSSKYVGEFRTTAGQGKIPQNEKINSHFVTDLSTNVQITQHLAVFGSVLNILNATYEVSRRPAGLRPGLPRSFRLGIKADLN